jgi:hypothetical protein
MQINLPLLTVRAKAAIEVARNVVRSGLRLCGALGATAVGAAIAAGAVSIVREPDTSLLQQAAERASRMASPSPADERDLALGMMVIGLVIVGAGLRAIERWFRAPNPR